MRFIIIISLFILLVCNSGCTTTTCGTYTSMDNPEHTIELSKDRMYVLHLQDHTYIGQYHISKNDGGILYLAYPSGYTITLIIKNKTLIDEDGTVWKKQ
jgi:hypothetical protein